MMIRFLFHPKGEPMAFGTFIDQERNFFDTVHFPASYKAYPFTGDGVYLILGEVTLDFDCPGHPGKKNGTPTGTAGSAL